MTLILITESHGEVESGFFSVFTNFTRLGEYAFATRHMCELTQLLSKHPSLYKTRILGYDADKFWEKFSNFTNEILDAMTQSYLPELQQYEVDKCFEQQGEITLIDRLSLEYEGRIIPVEVAKDEKSIAIGKYTINAFEFRCMVGYLAGGGWLGWKNKPEYAEPTMRYLENPTRRLFEKKR